MNRGPEGEPDFLPQRGGHRTKVFRPFSRLLRWLLLGALALCLLIGAINLWIVFTARSDIIRDIGQLPANDVALVLGTAPRLGSGRWKNPFFENRIDAAAELYHAGKVRHLLVSGDNRRKNYDE